MINGWNQKLSDEHPQGCLVDEDKPFGKNNPSLKKNLCTDPFYKHIFTLKTPPKKYIYASNHTK